MRRHSLLIGVGQYEGSPGLTPLNCPPADVEAVAGIVSDPRFMGPEPRHVPVINPTWEEALTAIAGFLEEVERDDVVLFYFAGHGLRDARGDLFLCFRNSRENSLEMTALNVKRLRAEFENKLLRRVLVVLDCCYSGAAAQMTRDAVQGKLTEMERTLDEGKGLYVLSSAGTSETAKEGEENGVFTHHLVDGIRSGAADVDGKGEITVQDLANYLAKKVPEDAPGQTPNISMNAMGGTFVVALNEAKKRQIEEAEADKRRQAAFAAARERVIDAFKAEDVSAVFMQEVLDWIKAQPACPLDGRRFTALEEYGARRIGLLDFAERWGAPPTVVPEKPKAKVGFINTPRPAPPAAGSPVENQAAPWRKQATGSGAGLARDPAAAGRIPARHGPSYRLGRMIARIRLWLIALLFIAGHGLLGSQLLISRLYDGDLQFAMLVTVGLLMVTGVLAGTLPLKQIFIFALFLAAGIAFLVFCVEEGYTYIPDRPTYIASYGERTDAMMTAAVVAPSMILLTLLFRLIRRRRGN